MQSTSTHSRFARSLPASGTACTDHPHTATPPALSYKFVLALQGEPEPALLALPDETKERLQLDDEGRPLVLIHVRGERAARLLPGLEPTWAMRSGEDGSPEGAGEVGLDALRRRFGTLLGRLEKVKAQGNDEEGGGVGGVADSAGEEWEFGVVKGRDKAGREAWWFEGVELRGE